MPLTLLTRGSRHPTARSVLDTPPVVWWAIYILVWTLQVGLYAFASYYRRRGTAEAMSVGDALLVAAIDWYLWAAICVFCFWIARLLPLERYRLRFLVPVLILSSFAITFVRSILDQGIAALLGWDPITLMERIIPVLPGRFILILLFIGVGYAIEYIRLYREREVNAAHLRAELATTQLQMLKMQLQPHFLFNTLHAISSLMYIDVEAADRMLVRLSELLRRTLQTMDTQLVTLDEELTFTDLYLGIEGIRLGDRLSLDRVIEPGVRSMLVPHLILQPLVENAVRHGIAPRIEGGRITITARATNGELELSIIDDGVGSNETSSNGGTGVGLTNSRARLHHLYGARGGLEVESRPAGGTRVTVTLPLLMGAGSQREVDSLPDMLEQVT